MEKEVFICDCHSPEHQVVFSYDEEDNEVWIEPHLINYNGFFKRLWIGLKYAFGYTSKFGPWDCMIFQPEDIGKLREFLSKVDNTATK